MYFTVKHKALIDQLQESHPIAFPKKPLPKVPLAHGQHRVIQAILDIDYDTADTLLYHWCQGKRYDLACSVEGAPCYTVDGAVKGQVSPKQAKFHKDRLDEYYAARAAPKGYTPTVTEKPTLIQRLIAYWGQRFNYVHLRN